MSNNKQSSVEWVINELTTIHALLVRKELGVNTFNRLYDEIVEKAKAMHKEECIDLLNRHNDIFDTSEEHYNNWFGDDNEQAMIDYNRMEEEWEMDNYNEMKNEQEQTN